MCGFLLKSSLSLSFGTLASGAAALPPPSLGVSALGAQVGMNRGSRVLAAELCPVRNTLQVGVLSHKALSVSDLKQRG